jgi:quercetin dioxygenase-like cupin family protein
MKSKKRWPVALGIIGVFMLMARAHTDRDVVSAQTHKRVFVTRLYTGPDHQTHSEEVESAFTAATAGTGSDVSQLMRVTGAELHRIPAGTVQDWHTAPRRQYVITLSGRGEIEVAGGKKIPVEPGHIELVEDTTGKGHITRAIGSEDRVTLQLPLVEQSAK